VKARQPVRARNWRREVERGMADHGPGTPRDAKPKSRDREGVAILINLTAKAAAS